LPGARAAGHSGPVIIRRERPTDAESVHAVHASAFASTAPEGTTPVEAGLVDTLRATDAWLPALSFVALDGEGVVGHVVCTRAHIDARPVLALGPLGVRADRQRGGVGGALMHTVLGAADALDEPIVVLLGHTTYYPRFGFRPAAELGITPPVAEWAEHFMALPLTAHDPSLRGEFAYAAPFMAI